MGLSSLVTIESRYCVTEVLTQTRCRVRLFLGRLVPTRSAPMDWTMTPTLHWIRGRWAGRLAVSARPRGGDWLRDEVKGWRASGVDIVISLLTSDEVDDLDLNEEAARCQEEGIGFVSFPIADRAVPRSREETEKLLRNLEGYLAAGKTIVIHCRQGLGRSALIAAGLLVLGGTVLQEAFTRLSASRGSSVPETEEQRQWVEEFARDIAPAPLAS